eukprot:Skav223579  [mRNA]  locus=scaffold4852:25068:26591:+ [translate_table: standard]
MFQSEGSSASHRSPSNRILRAKDPSHRSLVEVHGYSDLHVAVHFGDPELIRQVLSEVGDEDIDACDAFQRTPLMIAVLQDDLLAARSLLKAQAGVTQQDSAGRTPLAIAVQEGHHYCMLLLMHHGAMSTLQTANYQGTSPIHFAASSGDLFAVKLLAKLKCNFMARGHDGKSALELAADHAGVVAFIRAMTTDSANERQDLNRRTPAQDLEMQAGNADDGEDKRHHTFNRHSLKLILNALLERIVHKIMYPDHVTRRVVPVFCHCACACAIYEHVTVSRSLRWLAMPTATLIFEVSVPVILVLSQYIIRMDPGIVPEADGLKEFMALVASDLPREKLPKLKQLCTTTWILKGLRTKYCSMTSNCIQEFDHFCILLNAPIGKRNHRLFICLIILEVVSQISHCTLCLCTLAHEGPYRTYSQAMNALMQNPAIAFLLFVHSATVPGIGLLILVQLTLISQSITMNEALHMYRYEHFWSERKFTNPFSKGSIARNCWDFWWMRTRGEMSS